MAHAKKIEVFVVIEGGAKGHKADARFREGYRSFLTKIAPSNIKGRPVALEPIRGEGRTNAHKKFAQQRILHPSALVILLIDTDAPFTKKQGVWSFLESRDHTIKPNWATESHAYLMVQCVETWIVADHQTLKIHYGPKFRSSALPSRTGLEDKPHHDVQKALEDATSTCQKDKYDHVDSSDLIKIIDPKRIEDLWHVRRLRVGLRRAIQEFARKNP